MSWIDMDGQRYHSVGGSITTSFQVRTQYLDASPEEAQSLVNVLSAQERLWRVVVLFSQSMDAKADDLKRFIFGWIALEIFVNKVFRNYEQTYVNELTSSTGVHGATRFFQRISDVMKDKYSLMDRFSIVAAVLEGEVSDADVEEFARIKKIRDSLFHGQDIPEASLPHREVRALLGKYLRKHLDQLRS